MNKENITARFLDDMDITLSMDNRQSANRQITDIILTVQPIIFRVSYRDINLITSIVNKAIALSTPKDQNKESAEEARSLSSKRPSNTKQISSTRTVSTSTRRTSKVKPRLMVSSEHVRIPIFSTDNLA